MLELVDSVDVEVLDVVDDVELDAKVIRVFFFALREII